MLTKEEIQSILQMLEVVPFRGIKATEDLVRLRDKLVGMLDSANT